MAEILAAAMDAGGVRGEIGSHCSATADGIQSTRPK
jgi:hypothetical protein